MHSQSIALLAAAALLAVAASPTFAEPGGNGNGNGNAYGYGYGHKDGGIAAPGPIAGAGLGYLVLAGGYYVVRRWRKQKTGE